MFSTIVEAIVPTISFALFLSHTPSSGSIPDAPVPHLLQAVLAPSLVLRGIGAASQPGRRCDFAVSCG